MIYWQLATGVLFLDKPCLMGIVNLTPDSFSDGGNFLDPQKACARIERLTAEGAGIIDLGAESTRPGSQPVPADEQLRRLMPVLDRLTDLAVPLSIDTSEAKVIREVASHPCTGAINDVRALTRPQALQALAETNMGICLMHMQGSPHNMQHAPSYGDVIAEVESFLLQRAAICTREGIEASRICLDPGFGFGKTLRHNLELFHALDRFAGHGHPLLIGVSRKRMLADLIGDDKADRALASALASALAARRGAHILRVHDVLSTAQALALIRRL